MSRKIFMLTGDKRLDKKLAGMQMKTVRKIAYPAMRKAQTVMVKAVKDEIPAILKDVRRIVGKRFNKAKSGESKGQVVSKVGFGVGMTKKQRAKEKERDGQRKRRGVGMSSSTVHWAAIGTKKRKTKLGKNTGKMMPIIRGALKRGIDRSRSQAMSKMRDEIRENIRKLAASN